jgi:hypothetical protein
MLLKYGMNAGRIMANVSLPLVLVKLTVNKASK